MSSIDFVVPGDIDTPTGGYIYDREILAGLRSLKWQTTVHALDASFPQPTPPAARAARATFAAIPDGSLVVIDGLALPGLGRVLADEQRRLRLVALVHHPVALETGLEPALAQRYEVQSIPLIGLFRNGRLERAALGAKPRPQLEAELGMLVIP
mgnify:CR=1 FL=1